MNRRLLKSMFQRIGGSYASFNSTLHKTAPVLVASALVFSTGAQAANPQGLSLSASQPEQVAITAPNIRSADMYIVQLDDPAVATYNGGIIGFAATSAKANGASTLDGKSEAVARYSSRLQSVQTEMLNSAGSSMGRTLTPKFTYQHAINGFAVQMSRDEAKIMGQMAGVKKIQRERIEYTLTDQGPELIRAQRIWQNGKRSSRGEGLVIAVLDSGINSDHPSFAAVGGDGYQHENPLGSGNFVPGSYCDTVDPSFCNDKLIGAWDFTDIDGTVPEDDDGHGSHTASTAAGNVITGADIVGPTATASFDITGVAPHANIIAYDVCQTTCPGAALIAAINQVIIDASNLPNGIASLNYSISGGGDPYNDPVELGFLAAVESGVYVAASAGNSGPAAGTVAHVGPWVSTTGASTHSREIPNTLGSLVSDGGNTPDLKGLGFTSGFGPAKIVNSADYEADFPGATLCGVGEAGSGATSPFPAGTFDGEIVACTRGAYGRIEKGENVLAGGAGGYVLMDTGGGVVGDPHALPGVHISADDGATLSTWLAANKDNNPMATISGFSIESNADLADVMAGFSSRGPNQAFGVLKPDVTAPGVSILAANASTVDSIAPEFQFLSGTSMSSPHNAGAGALLSASRPSWTPQEIKSAIMLTAVTKGTTKEDGVTATDPFDLGAGRIQLGRADRSGLIMNETIGNFRAANPEEGGDPKSLNLASVMDSNCVGTCTWTRTVTNTLERTGYWNITATGDGFDAEISVLPPSKNRNYNLKLERGQSGQITVTANNYNSADGWQFGEINIDAKQNVVNDEDFADRNGFGHGFNDFGYAYKVPPNPNKEHAFTAEERRQKYIDRLKQAFHRPSGPDLRMPMAVLASKATDPSVFNKSVDVTTATAGDTLTYGLSVTNGQVTGPITVIDTLPAGTTFVDGSATETITLGTTDSPLSYDSTTNTVSWTGELEAGALSVEESPSPFGYFSLGDFGVVPLEQTCNGDCDDGGFLFTVPAFTYNGQTYTETLVSINGTIEAGSQSLQFVSASNTALPDVDTPNNLIAPLWRDLDLSAGGNMYMATLNAGTSGWTIYEWEEVPHFSSAPGPSVPVVTMQVWIGVDGTDTEGNIHYVYNRLDDATEATVGAENDSGTIGSTYYFDGAGTVPVVATDLAVTTVQGGQAELGFQVVTDCSEELVINRAAMSAADANAQAIAVTACEQREGEEE